MDPVRKALWFVESHWRDPLSLDAIARQCKVSPYHLTRAFAATLGMSLMRYVRGRRLSAAARQLIDGADDILAVALDAGYSSHEAFTRAFRDQFGLTPEQVRAQGADANIPFVEAIAMTTTTVPDIAPPRFETHPPLLLAGLVEHHECQTPQSIPNQWQKFVPYLGNVPAQVGQIAYGVTFNFDGDSNFDYLCGMEVKRTDDLPREFRLLQLPAQKYAVFVHAGHVAGVRGTYSAIWSKWFPQSGHQPVEAPLFERYGAEFNGVTGLGGFEIWIPVQG
ncbi:MAG: helix-turn-helix domain-containing protein [Pirellulales bacterium]